MCIRDRHWDAIGAGAKEGDVVNVVGTSTCIIAYVKKAELIPGVCGVVQGSVHPDYTGVEAGLSATGDIFSAIARRANTTVAELSLSLIHIFDASTAGGLDPFTITGTVGASPVAIVAVPK